MAEVCESLEKGIASTNLKREDKFHRREKTLARENKQLIGKTLELPGGEWRNGETTRSTECKDQLCAKKKKRAGNLRYGPKRT